MSLEPQPESHVSQIARSRATITSAEDKLSLMDVWRVILKQRYIILTVTVISIAVAAVYSFKTKPLYESVSRIEINPKSTPKVGLQTLVDESEGNGEAASLLQTEILVLQSDSVILKTAQSLDLLRKLPPGVLRGGKSGGPESYSDLTPKERRALIGYVKSGLHVQNVQGTQMVDIRYRNNDPKLAAEVVNKLMDSYVDMDIQSKFERTMHVSVWLEKQLEELKKEATNAQFRLADFQKQHNIVGTDETSNLTMQNLSQLSGDLESAEADRIIKEARMREFEAHDSDIVALMGDNPSLATLRSQLNDLQLERTQLSAKYGDRYPKMQDLKLRIEKVQASINSEVALARRQINDEYKGSLRSEQMLRKRLDAQKDEAYKLNEVVGQYSILHHEAELNRDLYDTLQMRLKEAGVMAGLSATNIIIVDRAQAPFVAVAPKKALSMLMGLLGGLLGGVVLAFVVESIDDRLQTSEEVESISTLASLATIPHIAREMKKHKNDEAEDSSSPADLRLIALRSPESVASEAYRGLRSSLLLSSIDQPPRVIVLTSAFPNEGKTTTTVNCAIALAQRGDRVLLVDADLRRGSLGRTFGLENSSFGLSTVLTHPEGIWDLPAPVPELPLLHVLPTGPRPPNPAEMLSSNRMAEQLRKWIKEYDRIVIDSAPLLAVSDTQALAVLADTVILVVRAGMTRKRALVRARDLLWRINAPIAGIVVNDVDMRLENFYTYRYGMYGYQYGQKYPYAHPYSSIDAEPADKKKGD
ncbi:MAG: polysaccharide biosynthesis tyrosine autokinase [Terracidiphilus sp.]|nr:polysaccharide biosynthesis tyrosine autokinase [Terracidiphilus sp.]